ncbi:MAG: hypothetical protein EZS28_011783 [Streblomastix strix]|uniref:Tyr recombinase domain-containing protein n=1 Tax=Streblomastix strix TaxID=222440 RepID=A0A5J4WCK8_9EUKA|nr:MAG: hypothetical protein EZS28_011783 [Streblomastix strix]
MLPTERPDVHIVYVLCWLNELSGKQRKSKLLLLKTHVSATFAQFSKMSNIIDSLLIKQFTTYLNLNTNSKARYDAILDIEILFKYIRQTTFSSQQDKQLLAMTLLDRNSTARITVLQRMTMDDITMEKDIFTISTMIKKGNKVRNEKITLLQRNNQLCPVLALKNWMKTRSKLEINGDSLFWNFYNQVPTSSYYCSRMLTGILRNSGNNPPYNGPSIRHASITNLRSSGASVTEVNAFSRHILTSTVVDAFYFRPVQRDLGQLQFNNNRFALCVMSGHSPNVYAMNNNPNVYEASIIYWKTVTLVLGRLPKWKAEYFWLYSNEDAQNQPKQANRRLAQLLFFFKILIFSEIRDSSPTCTFALGGSTRGTSGGEENTSVWVECDDTDVRLTSLDEALQRQAYVLVYMRKV